MLRGLAFEERGWPVIQKLREVLKSLLLFFWSYGLRCFLLFLFFFFVELQKGYPFGRSYMHEHEIRYHECIYDDMYNMI